MYCVGHFTDVFSLAATIVRLLAYGDLRSHDMVLKASAQYGTCKPWLHWHAMSMGDQSKLAAALARQLAASKFPSARPSEDSAVRFRLAELLLMCLQVRYDMRPSVRTVKRRGSAREDLGTCKPVVT